MLRHRILTAVVLLPLAIGLLALGGWWFRATVGLMLSLAAWEYIQLMQVGDHVLWPPIVLALVWLPLADLALPVINLFGPGLAVVLPCSLVWAMGRYTRGERDPTSNWALAVAGGLYLGWLGSHFVRLRELDDGLFWALIAFGSTWLADSGAYFVGRTWGRHKMTPRLSPGKSWEGYIAGLLLGPLFTAGLAALFGLGGWHGFILGILVSLFSPIGDLGVSMIKRQVGVKDTSNLFPGHGGMLDRIDSLLISVTLATYYVVWIVR